MATKHQILHRGFMETSSIPGLRTKMIFWLLLAVLSVAVAEVSVASAPFAFVNPFETVFLISFYGSHLLVVAWAVFRRGWPTLAALWFGGALFGLYEFYITKVLWSPPWGDTISMAHVDVIALIVLVMFWHPFMAFIFPLAVGEAVGSKRGWVADQLPTRFTRLSRRRVLMLVGLAAGTHGLVTGSPEVALVSTVSALAVVLSVSRWWRRHDRHRTWDLRELLPNDGQIKWIALLVAAQYLVFIPAWSPEKMPPLVGHVVVWLLYTGFAMLLHSALRQSVTQLPEVHVADVDRRILRRGTTVILGLSILGALGPPELGFVVIWLGAVIVGLRMLIGSIRHVLRQSQAVVSQ